METVSDLEQSIELNKTMLRDVIANRLIMMNAREDSQGSWCVPNRALDIIKNENERLQGAINRISCEISQAQTLIEISAERCRQSKERKRKVNGTADREAKSLKATLQEREVEIRDLEEKWLDIEEEAKTHRNKKIFSPASTLKEGKKLISKIVKQLEIAKSNKSAIKASCKNSEKELKRLQSAIKTNSTALVGRTESILKRDYGLGWNYKGFWCIGIDNEESGSSYFSSNSVSEQLTTIPKVSPGGSPLSLNTNNEPKISRLELAFQNKCEESQSLKRILNDLQAIELLLVKALQDL